MACRYNDLVDGIDQCLIRSGATCRGRCRIKAPHRFTRAAGVGQGGPCVGRGTAAVLLSLCKLFSYDTRLIQSGSTALLPGITRINLRLRKKAKGLLDSVPQPDTTVEDDRSLDELFDEEGMPLPHIREPLFELFYQRLSQHFPAISRRRMNERIETNTMSQFLANCICALAARFAPEANSDSSKAAAPFIAQAQSMLVPMTQLPTTEATSGLILLAWASYGQGNESGFWQYCGMAIRMGMDLGIHEVTELYDSPQHLVRTRLLWWTLFASDRIIAFQTGRPATIPEDCICIPLPMDQDCYPDSARDAPGMPPEPIEPAPFVYFVRLLVIVGRISNVLNGRRGKPRTLVSTPDNSLELLAELQGRLLQFTNTLPASLQWSGDNLKHADERGHSVSCFDEHELM